MYQVNASLWISTQCADRSSLDTDQLHPVYCSNSYIFPLEMKMPDPSVLIYRRLIQALSKGLNPQCIKVSHQ